MNQIITLRSLVDVSNFKKENHAKLLLSKFYIGKIHHDCNTVRLQKIRNKFYKNKNAVVQVSIENSFMCGFNEYLIKII